MLNPTGTGQAQDRTGTGQARARPAGRQSEQQTRVGWQIFEMQRRSWLQLWKRLLSQHLLGTHLQKPYLAAGQTSEVPPNLSRH